MLDIQEQMAMRAFSHSEDAIQRPSRPIICLGVLNLKGLNRGPTLLLVHKEIQPLADSQYRSQASQAAEVNALGYHQLVCKLLSGGQPSSGRLRRAIQ